VRPSARAARGDAAPEPADDGELAAERERRAEAVLGWLSAHGIGAGRITAAGAGEARPVTTGSTEADHQANRRVEIRIKGS
jgi:flagellar motor protein MotB